MSNETVVFLIFIGITGIFLSWCVVANHKRKKKRKKRHLRIVK